jgi:virulence-associated protein VagC
MAKTGFAKLFRNGRSQAVRLPQEFRFQGDRVRIRRVDHQGVLLEPFIPKSLKFIALDGRIPLPTRARIRLTLAGLARRARSSKYSSVRTAETFSACASVMSWLSATPSDSAALRASANRWAVHARRNCFVSLISFLVGY